MVLFGHMSAARPQFARKLEPTTGWSLGHRSKVGFQLSEVEARRKV
jgi:hypothetical protein